MRHLMRVPVSPLAFARSFAMSRQLGLKVEVKQLPMEPAPYYTTTVSCQSLTRRRCVSAQGTGNIRGLLQPITWRRAELCPSSMSCRLQSTREGGKRSQVLRAFGLIILARLKQKIHFLLLTCLLPPKTSSFAVNLLGGAVRRLQRGVCVSRVLRGRLNRDWETSSKYFPWWPGGGGAPDLSRPSSRNRCNASASTSACHTVYTSRWCLCGTPTDKTTGDPLSLPPSLILFFSPPRLFTSRVAAWRPGAQTNLCRCGACALDTLVRERAYCRGTATFSDQRSMRGYDDCLRVVVTSCRYMPTRRWLYGLKPQRRCRAFGYRRGGLQATPPSFPQVKVYLHRLYPSPSTLATFTMSVQAGLFIRSGSAGAPSVFISPVALDHLLLFKQHVWKLTPQPLFALLSQLGGVVASRVTWQERTIPAYSPLSLPAPSIAGNLSSRAPWTNQLPRRERFFLGSSHPPPLSVRPTSSAIGVPWCLRRGEELGRGRPLTSSSPPPAMRSFRGRSQLFCCPRLTVVKRTSLLPSPLSFRVLQSPRLAHVTCIGSRHLPQSERILDSAFLLPRRLMRIAT
ncbi:hypothetical protein PR048_017060 [Dryococelus australis]|uniref:Uncharacterized protein n=1 Tax=Dryococelus australis TaxID=614101 RepID=A0ABQ9H8F8_9NEOP|nr:hypothetical protein PR048_017060 [Dryococelus australis]